LAFYHTQRGAGQRKLDRTNNVTEQVIGQCVEEWYRSIGGYKRQESIRNVSSLIGWVWTKGADYNLVEVAANCKGRLNDRDRLSIPKL
jgi:hypothetical protein